MAALEIFFPLPFFCVYHSTFVVSTFGVISAGPTGCLEMLWFLLPLFCWYCNFTLNVTSNKTRFASEAQYAWKSLFKQSCQEQPTTYLFHSEKCTKDSLATFNTISHVSSSLSYRMVLTSAGKRMGLCTFLCRERKMGTV